MYSYSKQQVEINEEYIILCQICNFNIMYVRVIKNFNYLIILIYGNLLLI